MTFRASPSQLSTWKMCNRKWFYSKVMKLPEPQHASAALGTAVHAALEDFIQRKPVVADAEVGRILTHVWNSALVQQMLSVGANIEQEINVEIGGMPLMGRIDANWQDGNVLYIVDHKTTKDFKWAKSEEEAVFDPQTVVYAHWALNQPGVETVVFHYHYIRTASPAVEPRLVTVTHTRETLAPYVQAAADILIEMKRAKDLTEHEVERTPDACWAFGGCAFRDQCWASPSVPKDHVVSDFSKKLEGLFGGAPAASAPTATPAAAPAPKFTPAPTPAAAPPPVQVQAQAVNGGGSGEVRPIIYFGCAPINTQYEFLEAFLDRTGFLKRFADGNKGQYYLNSDFNRGPGVVAVDFAVAVHKGAVQLPAHLVVPENSAVGRFLQIEQRYLEPKATLIARSPF